MTIGERIKQLRQQQGVSQVKLAETVHISKQTLYKYENNIVTNIPSDKIEYIAKALQTTPSFLMGWEDSNLLDTIPVSTRDFAMIPVVGDVSAGLGCMAQQTFDEYSPVYLPDITGNLADYFYLKIKGDSMTPVFIEDDLVLIRKQVSVDSGSYAVALIDGIEGVLKKVVYGPTWVELQSINPMYSVRRFEDADLQRVEIIGLVKQVKRNF